MRELRGFLTVERGNVKNVKIITLVCEKHFPILRYDSQNMISVKRIFNKLNYRYGLGETWFINMDSMIFSISFNLFPWISFRGMIFTDGISKDFKDKCVANRYGCLIIKPKSECVLLFKVNESHKNDELKSSLREVLFRKEQHI